MVASQYDSTPCSNFIYRAIDGCLDVSKAGKTSRQTTSQNHHFDSIYPEWCCIQNHLSFLTENRSMFLLGNERFHFLNLDVVQFTLQLAVGPLQLVVLGQSLFQFTVERPTPKIDLNYRNSSNKKQTCTFVPFIRCVRFIFSFYSLFITFTLFFLHFEKGNYVLYCWCGLHQTMFIAPSNFFRWSLGSALKESTETFF